MIHPKRALQLFLTHDVWLIPVLSVVCTLLAALFPHSATGERFWIALEAMLLGFTLLYLLISYYAHYEYLNEVLKNQRSGLAGALILLSSLTFFILTQRVFAGLGSAESYPSPFLHLLLPIASIGFAILAACCVIFNGFDGNKMDQLRTTLEGAERVERALRYRQGYKLGLKYSDIPTFLGLILLAVVVGVADVKFGANVQEHIKTFVGGTVTFHLMLSNFVYAATSGE